MGVLSDVKKFLDIDNNDETFDVDITMHIDSALSTLNDLGIGPEKGLECTPDLQWSDLFTDPRLSMAKSVVYLQTKIAFDTPQYSFHISPLEKQLEEYKHRLADIAEVVK